VLTVVATWNATHFPWNQGFDAFQHAGYADYLMRRGEIPTFSTNGHWYLPPGFYGLAGSLDWVGQQLGLSEPHSRELVQLANVPLVVGAAVLTLALARLLWPGRPVLHLAALGLFVAVPIVARMAAMFAPETLALLLSTAALYLGAWMIVRRSFGIVRGLLLGALLGAGNLVRTQGLWTLAAILVVFVLAAISGYSGRRSIAAATLAVVVGAAATSGWWYVRQDRLYGSPLAFTHIAFLPGDVHARSGVGPQTLKKPVWRRRPLSFYVDPGLPQLFTSPQRPSFLGSGPAATYSELWGDWLDSWSGGGQPTKRELGVQNGIGLLPTLLALVGCVLIALEAFRRRLAGRSLARVLMPTLAVIGLVSYVYFTVEWPSPDGDVLKASYLLTTTPAWALAGGVALDRLGRRPPLQLAVLSLLGVSFLLDLRFLVFGRALGGLL
jgi:hypothetical protein